MDAAVIGIWVWTAMEIVLRVHDRLRNRGSTERDGHTRRWIVICVVVAVFGAELSTALLPAASPLRLPGPHALWTVAGLLVMAVGLGVRLWAVRVLGESFRTTVEVDVGQAVVCTGPYGWIRHPAYTGVLLITTGYGVAEANLAALLLAVVLPVLALSLRIRVEERALVETMGTRYLSYSAGTKRLLPGVW